MAYAAGRSLLDGILLWIVAVGLIALLAVAIVRLSKK
jgi:hypothetical protein